MFYVQKLVTINNKYHQQTNTQFLVLQKQKLQISKWSTPENNRFIHVDQQCNIYIYIKQHYINSRINQECVWQIYMYTRVVPGYFNNY